MEEVEDGLGSYIDIVLSIDPVATVPFWDVERDRIDLSLGPAYLLAQSDRADGGERLARKFIICPGDLDVMMGDIAPK